MSLGLGQIHNLENDEDSGTGSLVRFRIGYRFPSDIELSWKLTNGDIKAHDSFTRWMTLGVRFAPRNGAFEPYVEGYLGNYLDGAGGFVDFPSWKSPAKLGDGLNYAFHKTIGSVFTRVTQELLAVSHPTLFFTRGLRSRRIGNCRASLRDESTPA